MKLSKPLISNEIQESKSELILTLEAREQLKKRLKQVSETSLEMNYSNLKYAKAKDFKFEEKF